MIFGLIGVLVPILHLGLPETSALRPSTFLVTLVGKILCYATVAVALDLIWGFAGVLSLGHGLFFALGGYMWGMYLMRQIGREGSYKSDLPDFMVFLDWKELPWFWAGSDQFWFQKRDGVDTIEDFENGVDIVILADAFFETPFGKWDIRQKGEDVVIDFGHGDRLILEHFDANDLDRGDFDAAN